MHSLRLSEPTVTYEWSSIWYAGLLGFRYPVAAPHTDEKASTYRIASRNHTAEKTARAGRLVPRNRSVDHSAGRDAVENRTIV